MLSFNGTKTSVNSTIIEKVQDNRQLTVFYNDLRDLIPSARLNSCRSQTYWHADTLIATF